MDEYMRVAGPEAELSEADVLAVSVAASQSPAAKLRDPDASEKARGLLAALGGSKNVRKIEAVAETRLRVVVDDDREVNETQLQEAGVDAIMRLPNRILHLIVGPNADQYAAEVAAQVA
jgi:PTS system glucose-specific IIC component